MSPIKEAIIKFAISATDSKMDAARFLGIDYEGLHRLVREYNLQEYFDEINNGISFPAKYDNFP